MDLGSLAMFQAVVANGSFSAAARQLGYSQPAVSQQMRRLERRLGTPLFSREARGVRLTEAGEVLLRGAVDALSSVEAARQEIEALTELRAGRVRVVAFPSVAATVLPRAVALLAQQHPGLSVSFGEHEPDAALRAIADGTSDLGLVFAYGEQRPEFPSRLSDSLVTRDLFRESVDLALPRTHRLAAREQIELASLAGETWIAGPHRQYLEQCCRDAGFRLQVRHTISDYVAAQALIGQGLGIALLPRLVTLASHDTDVVLRALSPPIFRTVCVVSLTSAARIPAVRAMVHSLAAVSAGLDLT